MAKTQSLKVGDWVWHPEVDRGYGQELCNVSLVGKQIGIIREGSAVIDFVPRDYLLKLTPDELKALAGRWRPHAEIIGESLPCLDIPIFGETLKALALSMSLRRGD